MGKRYHVGRGQRAVNTVFRGLAEWGMGPRYLHVLTVTGRTSGTQRSVPVDVMDLAGERYLVAPYGEVNWVRNLRVAETAGLRRGRATGRYDAVELDTAHAVPVIREYVRTVPVTRDYWDIDDASSDAAVRAEAETHPVFRLDRHPA